MKFFLKLSLAFIILGGSIFDSFAAGKEFKTRVIFIHGWQFGRDKAVAAPEILSQIFPNSKLDLWSWDAYDMNFEKCDDKTIAEVEKLTAELEKLPPKELKELIIAGHSLGGKIAIKTMAALADKKIEIKQGIFLGSAIADNDPDIGKALKASRLPCINVYNLQDNILRHAYALYSLKRRKIKELYPLGTFGYAKSCRKDELFQIHASGTGNYIKDTKNTHYAMVYLKCLQKNIHLIDNITPGMIDYSTAVDAVKIPDYLFQTSIPIPRALHHLLKDEVLEEDNNWQMVKFHCSGKVAFGKKVVPEFTFWAIRDQRDRIVGWASDVLLVKKAWKDIKIQLEQIYPPKKLNKKTVKGGC